ncbi:hypothetical protein GSI_09115 [Ganoderma sinense ZZ0214-1]|uniref:Uncharacterized protein n=1 Tax=Ganoderma sinense ZZ0214-1 TaxID=1077348 RepID=A0A2G8S5Q3_9APHY|nr:hypothetical protein GSI_09115 [Ganoderma sinense ZZ0214-1]
MAKGNSPAVQTQSKHSSTKSTNGKPLPKSKKSKKGTTSNNSHDEESDEDELEEDGSGGEKKGAKKLLLTPVTPDPMRRIWDNNLTWSLITCISQNPSMASGGSKPKSDFYLELARLLFEDHGRYGEAFAEAKGVPAKLAKWAGKIKNRMNTLEKKTHRYFELMGETGQGISSEADINMNTNNSIKAVFLYYFEMLELIGQCPNVIHAGVGNSLTKVDIGAIMGGSATNQSLTVDDISSTPPFPASTYPALQPSASPAPSPSVIELDDNSDSCRPSHKCSASILSGHSSTANEEEANLLAASILAESTLVDSKKLNTAVTSKSSKVGEEERQIGVGESGKKVGGSETGKKTGAKPGMSTPASKGKGASKKLKLGDQFAEVATAEEQTLQKKLKLCLSQTKLEKLKLEGKIAVKRDKIRLKADVTSWT